VIGIPRAVRVWVHREPVDMRKSFDTLAAVVRAGMGADVLEGGVFVFVGVFVGATGVFVLVLVKVAVAAGVPEASTM